MSLKVHVLHLDLKSFKEDMDMQPQRDMFHQATKETTTRINDLFASVGGNGL